jgi:outer membrane protein OmpA-like peptidoglycan-associated protein
MKKIALGIVLAMSIIGCKARVQVQAKTPAPEPPKHEEPAPPPPEPVKVGEQIVLPDMIEFEKDSATIKETDKTIGTLNKLAEIMTTHKDITKLRIEGHTDNRGKAKHNEKLSQQRAEAVAKWLSEHGVDPTRMTTKGFGASHPIVPNDTADHRQANRRTEYYVDEVDGKKVDGTKPVEVAAGSASGGKASAN